MDAAQFLDGNDLKPTAQSADRSFVNTEQITSRLTSLPEKFGKYPVVGLAGTGNMGAVYDGYDPFADREVALKVCTLPEQGARNATRMARKLFCNEARPAGALDHLNILRVFDAGEERGQPYIVMEFVEGGETLQHYCQLDNLLPPAKVAEYIARCAAALDYAHRRGVVHRDIKPTNIMLTPSGDVKTGDFGIAQCTSDDTTHVLGMMGSPRDMSPEQISETELTGQTDLNSLGIVMFELLTGRAPFTATSLPSLFKQIFNNATPSPQVLREDIIDGLDSIVQCALEKERPYRYQNGAEFAADIAALFTEIRTATDAGLDREQQYEILRELGFFNEFSDSELIELTHHGVWRRLDAAQQCELAAQQRSYAVVLSGDAEIVRSDQVHATLGPGEVFVAQGTSKDSLAARANKLRSFDPDRRRARQALGAVPCTVRSKLVGCADDTIVAVQCPGSAQ
jgi:serine/threonine protein kinase